MQHLKEIGSDAGHWVGAYGPLLVTFWLKAIDPEACRSFALVARRLAMGQPGRRVSVISISLSHVAPPSAEARNALASLARDTGGCVSRVAVFREAHGFVASAIASVLLGIQLLARSEHPHRSFQNLHEAVVWATGELDEFVSRAIRSEDVVRAVREQERTLMARLQPRKSA